MSSLRVTPGSTAGGFPLSGAAADSFLPVEDRLPIYAIVENVRSLFNVGAIFRSADGVHAAGVYLTGFTGHPPRQEISRVALGADEAVPWRHTKCAADAACLLASKGVTVYALEHGESSVPYDRVTYRYPAAFIVGHEVEGVSQDALSACSATVHLPMLGTKSSLNVSVAAGIMFYHLARSVPG